MKLTKEQIQNIDEYLQRSGVTFWDIRIEVLDHFIIAIEEKLATNQLSFDEALMEVTVAFGNSIQERHLLSPDKKVVLFTGIFSNNKGFKDLETEKRKQIRKQYLKQCVKQLKENFSRINFYTQYLCFALALYVSFQYFNDWVFVTASVWLTAEILMTFYVSRKHKFTQESLRGEMSSKVTSMFFSITLNFYLYMKIVGNVEVKNIIWIMLMTLILYPIIKAVLEVHKKVYRQYEEYRALISVE